MLYFSTDENGRVTCATEREEWAPPEAIEIEKPEDFDMSNATDYVYTDGILAYSPKPPTAEEMEAQEKAARMQQMDAAVTLFVRTAALTDEQALTVPNFFETWEKALEKEEELKADTVIRHGGELYRVAKDHTPQAQWEPGEGTESLYTHITIGGSGYEQWKQPTGAHDAYSYGDIVEFSGELWQSTVQGENTNVWQPGVYGWEKYGGD